MKGHTAIAYCFFTLYVCLDIILPASIYNTKHVYELLRHGGTSRVKLCMDAGEGYPCESQGEKGFFLPGMCLAQPMLTTSSRSARSHSVVRALMSLSGTVGSGMA